MYLLRKSFHPFLTSVYIIGPAGKNRLKFAIFWPTAHCSMVGVTNVSEKHAAFSFRAESIGLKRSDTDVRNKISETS
jgi:hypothetical protein